MDGENRVFRLLYVIGIILVVTSHTARGGICLFTDWFPENSFHMQLFFFASGYFYKESNEQHTVKYIAKKIRKLVIPCLAYNLFYGVFDCFLDYMGFSIGEKFSLSSWLISPFLFGSDFKFNSPDWFIAQLFIVEVINVLIRKMFHRKNREYGQGISFAFVVLGISVTYIGWLYELSTFSTLLCRTLFCLSWYAIGNLYKKHEVYDRLNNGLYFGIIFVIQLVLLIVNEGKIEGSVVRFSFNIKPLQVYAVAALGIAFWLRISRIVADKLEDNKVITYIGKHTFSIVENQYLGIFALNTLLLLIHRVTEESIGFVEESYYTRHNYIFLYRNNAHFAMLYLLFGLLVPLLMSYGKEKMLTRLQSYFKRKNHGDL